MKRWMNRIGLALMAASAVAMIAADAFAGEPSQDFQQTSQKFYLQFTMFSPGDLKCDATGPGVRTKISRSVTGTPLLRVTGNVKGAQIMCSRSDGTQYTTDINRRLRYNRAGAIWATVTLSVGQEAASILIEREGEDDRITPDVYPRAFVKVQQ